MYSTQYSNAPRRAELSRVQFRDNLGRGESELTLSSLYTLSNIVIYTHTEFIVSKETELNLELK